MYWIIVMPNPGNTGEEKLARTYLNSDSSSGYAGYISQTKDLSCLGERDDSYTTETFPKGYIFQLLF